MESICSLEAPRVSSSATRGALSAPMAAWRGVWPLTSFASMSAPSLTKERAAFGLLVSAARCRGVLCCRSCDRGEHSLFLCSEGLSYTALVNIYNVGKYVLIIYCFSSNVNKFDLIIKSFYLIKLNVHLQWKIFIMQIRPLLFINFA